LLNEQTLTQLKSLRLDGMVAALADHASSSAASELRFEERLALLVQREVDWRDSKRLERLLKAARLKVSSACLEDIDWRGSRGLNREVVASLAGGDWLRHGHNVLLTGATGCGNQVLAVARIECNRLGQIIARATVRLLPALAAVAADGDLALLQPAALIARVEHHRAVGEFDELNFVRVTGGAFGFAVAAMLVPLLGAFDVAVGRTSGGAD
jgi:hypothetical protein